MKIYEAFSCICLRLKDFAFLMCAPPCSLFVGISNSVHMRHDAWLYYVVLDLLWFIYVLFSFFLFIFGFFFLVT